MAPRHALERTEKISALGVIAPPPIHVETPTFSGSLGMLFACVREHKVELLDIPLFPICEAYFLYLLTAEKQNLDEAAAALVALAYLLERKAWMLLPVPDPEPEYEEPMELIDPTAHEYRLAIETLQVWQEERSHLFFRSPDAGPDLYELPYTLSDVSIADLSRAFERLIRRAQPELPEILSRPRKSLDEQMKLVMLVLSDEWTSLDDLIDPIFTRSDLVYWFLALLELMRLGQVLARLFEGDIQFTLSQPFLPLEVDE
ncbi:MAG TPA: segregation/condensation protein A [Fimbriimonas sp.]|nr:segregation/condensation protein A [Fimbriimonas sp.]